MSVAEDGGGARFTLSLSEANDQAVTVAYATSDGTAEAGSDYTSTSGTLTMDAGSLSASVFVPVLDDVLVEPAESFNLNLGQATNATTETLITCMSPMISPKHFPHRPRCPW